MHAPVVLTLSEENKVIPAIEACSIAKSYGGRTVLRSVSLLVEQGEKLAIVGPNGAGKTTLLKILATLIRPTSGTARVNGLDIRTDGVEVRRRVGFIPHQPYLYHDLTVLENLAFYARMFDLQDPEAVAHRLVAQVGLAPRLHDRVGTLSRGMQQRVSIARAALHDPPVMLLDEPDTGLDQQAMEMLSSILNRKDTQRTVIMTTHNLDLGLSLCDRIAVLMNGVIVHIERCCETEPATFREMYRRLTKVQI